MPNDSQSARAKRCALYYRSLGLNPLPSRSDRKSPTLASYTQYHDEPLPDKVFDSWTAENIQLATGVRWKLLVVDLDGPEAIEVWDTWKATNGCPSMIWVVQTGSGGRHIYLSVPAWMTDVPVRTKRLWGKWDPAGGTHGKGDWAAHTEIKLLADRSLVVAPPSLHVDTKKPYEFLERTLRLPAEAPAWLLRLPAVKSPVSPEKPQKAPVAKHQAAMNKEAIVNSIPDKLGLVRSWGLRTDQQHPNSAGWIVCHAVGRPDVRPSAGFNVLTGVYYDHREGAGISLFDLATLLGVYPSWLDALRDLETRHSRP